MAKHGSLRAVGNMVEATTPGIDFHAEIGHVPVMRQLQVSQWDIKDHEEPELDEVFLAEISSVISSCISVLLISGLLGIPL